MPCLNHLRTVRRPQSFSNTCSESWDETVNNENSKTGKQHQAEAQGSLESWGKELCISPQWSPRGPQAGTLKPRGSVLSPPTKTLSVWGAFSQLSLGSQASFNRPTIRVEHFRGKLIACYVDPVKPRQSLRSFSEWEKLHIDNRDPLRVQFNAKVHLISTYLICEQLYPPERGPPPIPAISFHIVKAPQGSSF